MDLNTKSDYW